MINNHHINPKNNDDSDLHNDELGENTGEDTLLAKADHIKTGEEQDKAGSKSSNMDQGPRGEDL